VVDATKTCPVTDWSRYERPAHLRRGARVAVEGEHFGQLGGLPGAGEVEVWLGPAECDAVEKSQGMARGVTALPAQATLLMEPDQVGLNVLGGELIGLRR
jgi:hypothetical protein